MRGWPSWKTSSPPLVVKIEGSYHGHHDYVMVSIGVPYDKIGDPDNLA